MYTTITEIKTILKSGQTPHFFVFINDSTDLNKPEFSVAFRFSKDKQKFFHLSSQRSPESSKRYKSMNTLCSELFELGVYNYEVIDNRLIASTIDNFALSE